MRPSKRSYMVAMLCTALVLIATCAFADAGRGYRMSGAGGSLGYTSPENLDGTITVGGQLEFENDSRVHLVPNLNYWKVNQVSDMNPNVDVYYHFSSQRRSTPYLGGGLGLDVRNSDIADRSGTALSANVIGGYRFPGGSNHYYVEGRLTASDVSRVALVGGVTFNTR